MSHIIIIREYRQSDDQSIRDIVKQSYFSLTTDAFISTIMKEVVNKINCLLISHLSVLYDLF